MSAGVRGGGFTQRGSTKRLLLLFGILVLVMTMAFGARLKAAKLPPPEIRLTDATPRGQDISPDQRRRFATKLQERFSKKFERSKVDSEGNDDKTLKIEWSGVDRPFAGTITESGEIINDLRGLGFKRLIISDGQKSTWDVDLKN